MNRVVRSFNRSVLRPRYNGPDALVIEGRRIQLEGSEEMAVRKSPQVTPALDSSQADNTDRRVVALSDGGFNSIIRLINRGTIDRVLTIRTATFHTLKRLRVKRDLSKAVKRTPKGSDQGDIGTLGRWLDSVQRNDKKAVRQIVAIDATCCARGT